MKFTLIDDYQMCYYSDLFGDIIVTVEDVNLWLDTVADLKGCSNSQRNYYARFHDAANKIKLSKLDGTFEKIINEAEKADLDSKTDFDIFKTIYKNDDSELNILKCPDYFHICGNPNCAIYIKRVCHEKNAEAYRRNATLLLAFQALDFGPMKIRVAEPGQNMGISEFALI